MLPRALATLRPAPPTSPSRCCSPRASGSGLAIPLPGGAAAVGAVIRWCALLPRPPLAPAAPGVERASDLDRGVDGPARRPARGVVPRPVRGRPARDLRWRLRSARARGQHAGDAGARRPFRSHAGAKPVLAIATLTLLAAAARVTMACSSSTPTWMAIAAGLFLTATMVWGVFLLPTIARRSWSRCPGALTGKRTTARGSLRCRDRRGRWVTGVT